jgi:FG-GAP-like repeat
VKKILYFVIFCLLIVSTAAGEVGPLDTLRDSTLSYFKPLTGDVVHVEGKHISMKFGEENAVKPGMRLKVLREGAPFIHPVTKEVLGKVEAMVGKVEIGDVEGESAGGVLVEGEAREGDKVRVSDVKVKIFFCQSKAIDWYLADEYYRKLKGSGRVEMIDTALETDDAAVVLPAAKKAGAEIALILSAQEAGNVTTLRERLFWVSDGSQFIDSEVAVGEDYVKELRLGGEYFTPKSGEAMLSYDLHFGARFVASADVDGDGKRELVLGTGTDIRIYRPGVDLHLLWEIKGTSSDDIIWLDAIDLNKNGKDELIITSKRNDGVVSSVFALTKSGFKKLMEGNYFLRRLDDGLIAQAYSSSEGFRGDVHRVIWKNGGIAMGERIDLPKGVNIYDFSGLEGGGKEKLVFAYDEKGFLNLYDGKGVRIWRSREDTGGFLRSFKKKSPSALVETGEWSVKDRLQRDRSEVFVIQRVPLVGMAKGLGVKSSLIKDYWWNGVAMEESVVVDGIRGTVLDYALEGDQIIVLASPLLGLKFENILKGENPVGSTIFIYAIKGRL